MTNVLRSVFAAAIIALAGAAPIAVRAAAAEQATPIPATSAEIWKAIDMHLTELHAVIATGVLKTVHEHAFAIRDLVRALPSHSPGLTPDALAKVKAQVPFVDTLATRLDQTGDANDKPGTEANTTKLEKVLKDIRANYPAA